MLLDLDLRARARNVADGRAGGRVVDELSGLDDSPLVSVK